MFVEVFESPFWSLRPPRSKVCRHLALIMGSQTSNRVEEERLDFLNFEQEVSFHGQSRRISDEGRQDEFAVWGCEVLAKRAAFPKLFHMATMYFFVFDVCLSELYFSTLSAKKRRVLRLLVPKNALGFPMRSHLRLLLRNLPASLSKTLFRSRAEYCRHQMSLEGVCGDTAEQDDSGKRRSTFNFGGG